MVSEEGYKKILQKKREREGQNGKVISMAKALDSLLEELERLKEKKK